MTTPLPQPRVWTLSLLTVLFIVSSCFAQPASDPYAKRLDSLETQFVSSNWPQKAVLLDRMEWLREYVNDPESVSKAINRISEKAGENRLVRDEANWHRARIALHERRLADVNSIIDSLGFVQDWTLVDGQTCKTKDLAAGAPLRTNPLGTISIYGQRTSACVATSVYSAFARNAAIRFGANGPVSLYVNGVAVNSTSDTPAIAFDQHSVGVPLRVGWNTIAIQLNSRQPIKQFAVRITNPEGGGLTLGSDPTRAMYASTKATATNIAVNINDLLTIAQQAARYRSLESLNTLAELEQVRGLNPEDKQAEPANSPDPAPANSIVARRRLALQFEAGGQTGEASSLLNQIWKVNFDDAVVLSALKRLALRRGDNVALEMLAQAENVVDPSDPVAQFEIAKYAPSLNPTQEVRQATGSETGHLLKASQRETVSQTPENDSSYLVNASQLAAGARTIVPDEIANVIVLADVSVERMRDNGQTTIHGQQVFYIANDRGARDYGTRTVQYSSANQKLIMAHGRIYKHDGRVVEADDRGENSVADNFISMYYDTRSRMLRFPGLEKGDVIEIEYRIAPNSNANPYGNYFGALVTFQTGLPQRLHRYVLVAPTARKLHVVEVRMPVKAAVTQIDGETVYQWDTINLKPTFTEPRGPSYTEMAPYISISTIANWDDFGHWYADLVSRQIVLDNELRGVVARVTANAKSEPEKIQAIYEFVVRNTHYVAMEFGVYSYKPYPVSQVYARRFGDCKDKASLMIAMLRAVGIDAELALVRTRKLGDVSENATAISIFNHAIAYVPKYDLWLDGTAEYAGSRELPLDDQGAMALTVNLDGNATLRRIPTTLPMQNYTHRVVMAQVQSNGKILFNGSAYTRGEDAPGLRREYEMTERQLDTVRGNLAQVYPSVKVESVHVYGADDIERDVNVRFSGSLDTFAGQKTFSLEPSWLPHKYLNSLAPLEKRSQELNLPAPWTTEEELHFSLPDKAHLETLPNNLRYETPFGTAVIHYERHGRELVIFTSVQFRKLRIAPDEYPAFRAFCDNVEKAFHQEIKVRFAS